jgi:nucleoside-diphosphate-sugar epimerase
MAILITGGTGFVGSGLARRLVERGEKDIVLFDIAPNLNRVADIKDKVKIVQGDLKVWSEIMNVIKDNNIEGIFHLGSMLSGACEASPWQGYQVVVTGTMHVLEAARLFGVKKVVFSSSSATYGIGNLEVITEQTLQRPISIYGAGKLFGEHLGRFYRRKFGLDFRCVRYFLVIGPGTRNMPPYAEHMCLMIENTALGKPYVCKVREDQGIPLTYVKDDIRATEMLYYAPAEKIKTVCYNVVGVSPAKTPKELALTIKRLIPDAKITFKLDKNLSEFFDVFYGGQKAVDDSRAREEWGWKPLYSDFGKLVEDFIHEVKTRPQLWGLT